MIDFRQTAFPVSSRVAAKCFFKRLLHVFNRGRHLVGAQQYLNLRVSAAGEWSRAAAQDQELVFPGLEQLAR